MRLRIIVMASVTVLGVLMVVFQVTYLIARHVHAGATPPIQAGSINETNGQQCARDCTRFSEPRTCTFSFKAEWYVTLSKACYECPFKAADCDRPHCITANGIQRAVLAINRQIPGPSIQVCEGDRVRVTVENAMDNAEGISIHWHGHHQRGTPHMDGASMITQCPIPTPQSFTYEIYADTPGTHWWHAHSGLQRADGIYGAFIVRQRDDDDVDAVLYDVDDVDHVIMLSDWTDELGVQHMMRDLHADGPGEPDGILINGRGTKKIFEQDGRKARFEHRVFNVRGGLRHRFRIINTAVTNCPMTVSVQHHKILVITSDGSAIDPLYADAVTMSGGERFDVVLLADQPIGNYWLRVDGLAGSECEGVDELAIIRYHHAPSEPPPPLLTEEPLADEDSDGDDDGEASFPPKRIVVEDLRHAGPVDEAIVSRDPDVTFYLEVDSVFRNSPKLHDARYYPVEQAGEMYTAKRTHMLDNISFTLPTAPLLTHSHLTHEEDLCTRESLRRSGRNCAEEFCGCVHTVPITSDQVVELVLVPKAMKEFEPHPFHLHGNHFYVMSYSNDGQLPMDKIKDMISKGEIPMNLDRPPRKDTVMMGSRYVIIRFKADNPGWWFFHCHMDLHLELGMALVFRVGSENDIPPPPADMPVCAKEFHQEIRSGSPNSDNEDGSEAVQLECQANRMNYSLILSLALPVGILFFLGVVGFLSLRRRVMKRGGRKQYSNPYHRLSTADIQMNKVRS